jgi:hypothetical protein
VSLSRLERFCGRWEGHGRGYFPTILPFAYRERLTLVHDAERDLIQLELQAWKRLDGLAGEAASHHEVGAIVAAADGGFEMSTIQNGSRYERMAGQLSAERDGLRLDWVSDEYAHDARVIASQRSWLLTPEGLSYTMAMRTTAVGKMEPHLAATLVRRR